MSAAKVGELYDRAGDRLFARNIRGFLGDTAINEGMGRTLEWISSKGKGLKNFASELPSAEE